MIYWCLRSGRCLHFCRHRHAKNYFERRGTAILEDTFGEKVPAKWQTVYYRFERVTQANTDVVLETGA
jgi:hypothetical protein